MQTKEHKNIITVSFYTKMFLWLTLALNITATSINNSIQLLLIYELSSAQPEPITMPTTSTKWQQWKRAHKQTCGQNVLYPIISLQNLLVMVIWFQIPRHSSVLPLSSKTDLFSSPDWMFYNVEYEHLLKLHNSFFHYFTFLLYSE
jgi:hypothetical protein